MSDEIVAQTEDKDTVEMPPSATDVKEEAVAPEQATEKADDQAEGKPKEEAPTKTPVTNWPKSGIKDPHDNDVLYGRGGGTNHHPGNKRYRQMVEDRKMDYVTSKRLDKPLVALEIIRIWRGQDPPGRFLKANDKTGLWEDVGDKKAREKTSQALREKAPLLRQQQDGGSDEEFDDKPLKSTRFSEGTSDGKNDPKSIGRAVLARDHSLGRDYLEPHQAVTLDGFNWQEPVQTVYGPNDGAGFERQHSNSSNSGRGGYHRHPSWGRNGSSSSFGMAPSSSYNDWDAGRHHSLTGNPLRGGSISGSAPPVFRDGAVPAEYYEPPPVPDRGYGSTYSPHEQSGYLSNETSSSFSRAPSHGRRQSDGDLTAASRQASGRGLGLNPNAARKWSGVQSGDYAKVADIMGDEIQRSWSGGAYSTNDMYSPRDRQPMAPPQHYRTGSGGPYSEYDRRPISYSDQGPPQRSGSGGSSQYAASSPPYGYSEQSGSPGSQTRGSHELSSSGKPPPLVDGTGPSQSQDQSQSAKLPRPGFVKRATSNQNEEPETKHNVKRAVLGREHSLASRILKEEVFGLGAFDAKQEMTELEVSLQEHTLNSPPAIPSRPSALTSGERISTIDAIALEMTKPIDILDSESTLDRFFETGDDPLMKPKKLSEQQRMSTVDIIRAEFDRVPLEKPLTLQANDRLTTMDVIAIAELESTDLTKPPALSMDQRMSTIEAIQLEFSDKDWVDE
jgi:hypothetical protein